MTLLDDLVARVEGLEPIPPRSVVPDAGIRDYAEGVYTMREAVLAILREAKAGAGANAEGWIKVGDRLPGYGQPVLLWSPGRAFWGGRPIRCELAWREEVWDTYGVVSEEGDYWKVGAKSFLPVFHEQHWRLPLTGPAQE